MKYIITFICIFVFVPKAFSQGKKITKEEVYSALEAEGEEVERLKQIIEFLPMMGEDLRGNHLNDVIRRLYVSDAKIKKAIIEVLPKLEPYMTETQKKEMIKNLRYKLHDEDGYVRALSIHYLGRLEIREAISEIQKLLEYKNDRQSCVEERVREAAAEALGKMGNVSSLSGLLKTAFEDESPMVRIASAHAIARIFVRSNENVDTLLNNFESLEGFKRYQTVFILTKVLDLMKKNDKQRDPLIRKLQEVIQRKDEIDSIKKEASEGLKRNKIPISADQSNACPNERIYGDDFDKVDFAVKVEKFSQCPIN